MSDTDFRQFVNAMLPTFISVYILIKAPGEMKKKNPFLQITFSIC